MSNLTKEEQEVWDGYAKDKDKSVYTRENFLQTTVQRRREAEIQLLLLEENNRHTEAAQWLWGSAVAILGANLTLLVLKQVVG